MQGQVGTSPLTAGPTFRLHREQNQSPLCSWNGTAIIFHTPDTARRGSWARRPWRRTPCTDGSVRHASAPRPRAIRGTSCGACTPHAMAGSCMLHGRRGERTTAIAASSCGVTMCGVRGLRRSRNLALAPALDAGEHLRIARPRAVAPVVDRRGRDTELAGHLLLFLSQRIEVRGEQNGPC